MKKQLISLGKFEVVSPVLRISDPCYDKKTWCAGTVKKVKRGTWKAQVLKIDQEDNWGNRCRKLIAVHSSFNRSKVTIQKLNIDVGVDSGCAGIFDDKFYKKDFKHAVKLTGNCEYDQHGSLHRAKENLKMYQDIVDSLKKSDETADMTSFWEDKVEKYKAIIARGNKYDYSNAETSNKWYEVVCDPTFSDIGAGVISNGCASRSGDGDGSYAAYAAYDRNGLVVGVKIIF